MQLVTKYGKPSDERCEIRLLQFRLGGETFFSAQPRSRFDFLVVIFAIADIA